MGVEKIIKILYMLLIFFAGALFAFFLISFSGKSQSITGFTISQPSDFLKNNDIKVFSDHIEIQIKNALISNYENSDSMSPFLGEKSNGIALRPSSEVSINVGDVIAFKKDGKLLVHRVIDKGIDDQGIYFITKGDNNSIDDGKIRFNQIESVLVGIIY